MLQSQLATTNRLALRRVQCIRLHQRALPNRLLTTSRPRHQDLGTRGPTSPGGSAPEKPSNTPFYLALAAAGAAGLYWYYSADPSAEEHKRKAKAEGEAAKRKGKEAVEAGRASANEAYQAGPKKVDDAKHEGESRFASARGKAEKAVDDAEKRAREGAAREEANYEQYKTSAKDSLANARQSTEQLYREARNKVDESTSAAKEDVDRQVDEVKRGWFSWLGWGRSRTEEKKVQGARKVAETAEDVRNKAEKHT